MIRPLVIKNTIFPINLIQGPLAGVSCAPFRVLTSEYGRPAYTCTEMMSCKTLLYQSPEARLRYISKDIKEGPVCFQLSSNNPTELAMATRLATDYGADMIDLNCGCPVKKIRSKGAGSSLLTNSNLLYQLITAMKQNTHLPVSIKIRVQGDSDEKFNQEITNVVTDAGLDLLVVHGRHWTEHYDVPCRYSEIEFFVENLKIPVVGNGDISNLTSLKRMLETGCAGVMIGRAGVGQPWLIAKLVAEMQEKPFTMPDRVEIGAIFKNHVAQLAVLLKNEKFAILQARKFAKYYAKCLSDRIAFVDGVNGCDNLNELHLLILNYFK